MTKDLGKTIMIWGGKVFGVLLLNVHEFKWRISFRDSKLERWLSSLILLDLRFWKQQLSRLEPLGCNYIHFGKNPMFRRNISPTSSGSKCKPSKKAEKANEKLLIPEHGGNIFLRTTQHYNTENVSVYFSDFITFPSSFYPHRLCTSDLYCSHNKLP